MRFLEIKYVAYVKDSGEIFEETKDSITIPIGKGLIHKFLEDVLKDVEPGKTYTFTFEKPFGERDNSLIKIIPYSEFTKRGIKPVPGLIINVDGMKGIIRSVSGRVIVDFNHPMAGKDLIYKIEVIREVKDLEEKIKGLLMFSFEIPRNKIKIEKTGEKSIRINLPEDYTVTDSIKEFLKSTIEDIKDWNIE